MTVKTTVTNEQIAAAREAFRAMGEAAGVLQEMVEQLGWSDIDRPWELEELGGDEFVQQFFCCLDGCAYPGYDMIPAKGMVRLMNDELATRAAMMLKDIKKVKYVVVENAGYEGETDVKEFDDYWEAVDWCGRQYDDNDMEELHLAIAKVLPDGERTYEN